jgi:hypothetical protein
VFSRAWVLPPHKAFIISFYLLIMEGDMKKLKMSLLFLLAAALILGLVACEKEGPMEKAGKQVDEAVEKTEEAIKEKTE